MCFILGQFYKKESQNLLGKYHTETENGKQWQIN